MTNLWTTTQVMDYLGLGSLRATRVQMARWGIRPDMLRAENGEKRWPGEQVIDRASNRPGRGARTDLTAKNAQKGAP